jgi:hypothetical protein
MNHDSAIEESSGSTEKHAYERPVVREAFPKNIPEFTTERDSRLGSPGTAANRSVGEAGLAYGHANNFCLILFLL